MHESVKRICGTVFCPADAFMPHLLPKLARRFAEAGNRLIFNTLILSPYYMIW
jgi:hypothetical protein